MKQIQLNKMFLEQPEAAGMCHARPKYMLFFKLLWILVNICCIEYIDTRNISDVCCVEYW